ncbi:MAG: hypothetical protein NVSMB47_02310 [Polyangiales bacterium]
MAEILHKMEIRASRQDVFQALSTQQGLASWWTRTTKAEPRVGSVAEFQFGGGKFVSKRQVVALDPGARVAWKCIEGASEWVGTEITFELAEKDGETTVRFRHRGWSEASDFLAHCSYRWAYFLRSLKLYLQEGKGNPHPDDTAA